MNQEIVKDVGGSLTYEPTRLVRPTSAAVSLHTPAGSEHVASASAVVSTASTTADGAVAAGSQSITVVDAAGFTAGGYFVIQDTDGEVEELRASRVAGLVIYLHRSTTLAFSDGASVYRRTFTLAVSADNSAALDEGYEARWVITYTDSETERVNTLWDVVRSKWPDRLVTFRDLQFYGGTALTSVALESVDAEGLQFRDQVDAATEDVRRDILTRERRSALFRSFDSFRKPIVARLIATWAQNGTNVPSLFRNDVDTWKIERENLYHDSLGDALNTTRSYDADESGSTSGAEKDSRLASVRIRS